MPRVHAPTAPSFPLFRLAIRAAIVVLTALSIGGRQASSASAVQSSAPTASQPTTQSPAVLERLIAENLQLLTGNNESQARAIGARELLRLPSPAAAERLAAVLRNSADTAAQLAICQS